MQQAAGAAVSSVLKIMLDQQAPASTRLRAADLVLTHGARAIELEDVEARVSELSARPKRRKQDVEAMWIMRTKHLRRIVWVLALLGAVIAAPALLGQYVPPASSGGATSCSAAGALTLGAASGQASHKVIGTCGSATSFGPCSLVGTDLPAPSGGGPPGGWRQSRPQRPQLTHRRPPLCPTPCPPTQSLSGQHTVWWRTARARRRRRTLSNLRIRFGSTGTSSDTSLADLAITAAN